MRLRCNEQIRITPIRLITEDNEQVGIVPTNDALNRARGAGMDLVEVAPNEKPPVCRIMDYGKWKYRQKKKEGKQKAHVVTLKEVRMRPKTDPHDQLIKMGRAKEFLERGDKVQFTMLFRGREMAHRNLGIAAFERIKNELVDMAKVERDAKMEGRRMTMVLSPK